MTDESDYKYDVFISYRRVDPDQVWVRTQLKPALEGAGLKVLLDDFDFVPGADLVNEMTRAVKQSRRGICVLSPDYDSGRWVNFESVMLRGRDPSAANSTLIPLVLRSTQLPQHIQNLIAIDWTDPANHQREWTKLLNVLEAKDRKAPRPGPVGTAPPPPAPPPKPPPGWKLRKLALLILAATVLVILAALFYRSCGDSEVRTVQGRIYYERTAENTGLIPVENVVVYLKNNRDVYSKATGSDGRFVLTLPGIPASAAIALEAKYGTQFYDMEYQSSGDYPVIPREIEKLNITFIDTPWVEAQEPCLPDEGDTPSNHKVYSLNVELPGNQSKPEAMLTVELLESPNTTIRSAFVRATPKQFYRRETRETEDSTKSRTWVFKLPSSGLQTKLDVCLGSELADEKISRDKLKTHYKLQ